MEIAECRPPRGIGPAPGPHLMQPLLKADVQDIRGERVNRMPEASSRSRIEVRNLYKIFGNESTKVLEGLKAGQSRQELRRRLGGVIALEDIGITVTSGEIHMIMGLSGSGKSTLLRCMNRLIEPTAGQVLLDGKDVLTLSPQELQTLRRRKLSMVFQGFGLFPHMTVAENILYPLQVRADDPKEATAAAGKSLEVVGLSKWADHYPETLSGGMRQRVGLARALATGAQILLMDEPFSALDPLIRRELQDELIELQRTLQRTILFVTHDFHEAMRIGNTITVLKDGKLVQSGDPFSLLFEPTSDYIRHFSRGINLLEFCEARHVMQSPCSTAPDVDAPGISSHAPLRSVCEALAASERLLVRSDAGAVIGEIGRASLFKTLAESHR